MTTKYVCDVCGEETTNQKDMSEVIIKEKHPRYFGLCHKCVQKMLKPVKSYRTIFKLSVAWEEEG